MSLVCNYTLPRGLYRHFYYRLGVRLSQHKLRCVKLHKRELWYTTTDIMRKMLLSNRMREMPVSAVRKLSSYETQTKAKGIKIYHLNIGDPDIETPQCFIDALHNWSVNPIGYSPSKGEPSFLTSLAWYYRKLDFTFVSESNIIATIGGSEALVMSLFAVADTNDEVLVFEPFYSNYASCAAFCNIKLVSVPTSTKKGFHLPALSEIVKKIGPRTKAILLCSPNNPTGTVYTKKEYKMLVGIAKKYNVYLISDEVYREYVFDGAVHTSLLSFMEQIPQRAIMVDSLSKRYSLCGARLGVILSLNEDVIHGVTKIAQSRLSGGHIYQRIGAELVKVSPSHITRIRDEYQKRRDVLYKGLTSIPGVYLTKPEGAFYTMVTLPVGDAQDFCIFLLNDFSLHNETVMLAPGNGFYATKGQGRNQVRIAYVLNTKDIVKSIEIIRQALEVYRKQRT